MKSLRCLVACAATLAAGLAHGQNTFDNSGGGGPLCSTASNWREGVPTGTQNVTIRRGNQAIVDIDLKQHL